MLKEQFRQIVSQYSMTTAGRIDCLFDSLEHIRTNNIPGDYVECGVWKGGNILGIMSYLEVYRNTQNKIWLFDTFAGMTAPEPVDVDYENISAMDTMKWVAANDPINWCEVNISEVQKNLSGSNYPRDKVNFIVGDVCETLQLSRNIPEQISLLRLDTDWYASTKMELEMLWPRLSPGGVLIVDDYGHWKGCKQATDEFFAPLDYKMQVIDYTGVRFIKKL